MNGNAHENTFLVNHVRKEITNILENVISKILYLNTL